MTSKYEEAKQTLKESQMFIPGTSEWHPENVIEGQTYEMFHDVIMAIYKLPGYEAVNESITDNIDGVETVSIEDAIKWLWETGHKVWLDNDERVTFGFFLFQNTQPQVIN